jgi:hypothetical protein
VSKLSEDSDDAGTRVLRQKHDTVRNDADPLFALDALDDCARDRVDRLAVVVETWSFVTRQPFILLRGCSKK